MRPWAPEVCGAWAKLRGSPAPGIASPIRIGMVRSRSKRQRSFKPRLHGAAQVTCSGNRCESMSNNAGSLVPRERRRASGAAAGHSTEAATGGVRPAVRRWRRPSSGCAQAMPAMCPGPLIRREPGSPGLVWDNLDHLAPLGRQRTEWSTSPRHRVANSVRPRSLLLICYMRHGGCWAMRWRLSRLRLKDM